MSSGATLRRTSTKDPTAPGPNAASLSTFSASGAREGGEDTLRDALLSLALRPGTMLFAAWNWKTAAVSALVRASVFFGTNRRTGPHGAVRAMLVEALFSIAAAGLLGAVTQRLRWTRPAWATALIVWLALPAAMVALQAGVHHLAGTRHLRTGLIVSFVFAALASGFNWFAQRRGALLTSSGGSSSLVRDARALPRLLLDFVLAPFRLLRP